MRILQINGHVLQFQTLVHSKLILAVLSLLGNEETVQEPTGQSGALQASHLSNKSETVYEAYNDPQ